MSDFGDITSDDAYTAGDDEVNWDHVETVAAQIERIQAIPDADIRLAEAIAWAEELNGAA